MALTFAELRVNKKTVSFDEIRRQKRERAEFEIEAGQSLNESETIASLLPVEDRDSVTQLPTDEQAKMSNALNLSRTYGITFEEALQNYDSLSQEMWGTTNAVSVKQKINTAFKEAPVRTDDRKSILQASKDAYKIAGVRLVKSLAGYAQLSGWLNQKLTPFDVESYDKTRQWGEMMSKGVEEYYRVHPEELIQVRGDGFWDTTVQYLTHPEAIVQASLETVPMLLEAYLGHLTGVRAAEVIGKGIKLLPWMGRVMGIASPIIAETYAELRDRGIDPAPSLAQSVLTGVPEGIIEEWTLGKKIQIFKGAGNIAKKGIAKTTKDVLLGGTKAYTRGVAEESTQQINTNFWDIVFTDSDTKLLDNVSEAGAVGGLIELGLSGTFAGAGQLRRAGTSKQVSDEVKIERAEVIRDLVKENIDSVEDRKEVDKVIDDKIAEIKEGKPTPEIKEAAEPIPETFQDEIDQAPRFGLQPTKDGFAVMDWETQKEVATSTGKRHIQGLVNQYNRGELTVKAEPVARLLPSEPITLTERQLLNFVMKGMSKEARRSFTEGAKQIVKEQKAVVKFARKQLAGLPITPAQSRKLLSLVTKTRTEAQKIDAITIIEVIREKSRHTKATTELTKIVKFINNKSGKIMQKRGIRPEYLDRIKEVTDSFLLKKPTAKTLKAIDGLKKHIDTLRDSLETKYTRAYAEELLPTKLVDQIDKIGVRSVSEMTADEVEAVTRTLKQLVHLNQVKNKLILGRVAREAAQILENAVAEQDNVIDNSVTLEDETLRDTARKTGTMRSMANFVAGNKNHDVGTLIDTITGGQKGTGHEIIVEGFSYGRRVQAEYLNTTNDLYRKTITDNNISIEDLQEISPAFFRWFKQDKAGKIRKLMSKVGTFKETPLHKFQIGKKTFSFTTAEMMSVYMHAQAFHFNLPQMIRSGIASRSKKLGMITIEQIEAIVEKVEANPKALALTKMAADKYENISKTLINKTSLDLKGIKLAGEPDYWHVERFTAGGVAGTELYRISLLESEGRLQTREGSGNPIVIQDFFEVMLADDLAIGEYVGMAKPYRSMKMLLNYKPWREKVVELGYEEELRLTDTLIRDIEQQPSDDTAVSGLLNVILRGTVRSVLAEPGIMLGQYASTGGYFAQDVSKKYIKALRVGATQKTIDRFKANWPTYKLRVEGGVSSKALGDIANSDRALRAFLEKQDIFNIFTRGIHHFDTLAVTEAGRITEMEMRDKNITGKSKEYWDRQSVIPSELEFESEQYWDEFNKRADYLVRRSQPMFNKENRSILTIEPRKGIGMWFLFRSYVDQPLRIMHRANVARRNHRISRTQWANTIGTVWVSLAVYAAIRHMVSKIIYRDDDDIKDLALDVILAPVKLFTVIGYPLQQIITRSIDIALEEKPSYRKPEFSALPVKIANEILSAGADFAEGLGHLGTGAVFESGPRKFENKANAKFQDGTMKILKTLFMLWGLPVQIPQRVIKGLMKEKKRGAIL